MKIDVHKEDDRGNVYTLLEPLEYMGLTIPAGFESDGASVPRFFWQLVFPPGDSKALHAAFVHDYIYRTHPAGWTRADADKAFRELLIAGGIPARRANLAYYGVRWFGGGSWKEGKK
ncbi:DUF1353 domain-containing protein [Victivallis vadensis]|uniref:DUF1353 domain-containing protein n=1 Tax=Victivallis vadensis TaxID=172901 RepID=A0A848AZZ1_9BACT|nr:DUF1353 domain-containing protein [Victivallis vadensis]NMD88461.1 DUF1353 domain-containing protein [Victivallis vadensis]